MSCGLDRLLLRYSTLSICCLCGRVRRLPGEQGMCGAGDRTCTEVSARPGCCPVPLVAGTPRTQPHAHSSAPTAQTQTRPSKPSARGFVSQTQFFPLVCRSYGIRSKLDKMGPSGTAHWTTGPKRCSICVGLCTHPGSARAPRARYKLHTTMAAAVRAGDASAGACGSPATIRGLRTRPHCRATMKSWPKRINDNRPQAPCWIR